jgi:hypothetical protein
VVRHVFTAMNPQGTSVFSFKQPRELEAADDFLRRAHLHTPVKGEVASTHRASERDTRKVAGWLAPADGSAAARRRFFGFAVSTKLRSNRTGQLAYCTTLSATLPMRTCASAVRPCVEMTIKLASTFFAASAIA